MKVVHIADLHLGYRAYHRTDERGINVREADVAKAFQETLDITSSLAPQLLLVAGDVFHTVRPSNSAIADAFHRFSRFCSELPETRVVMIAGNHDSPRAVETGSILQLFREIPGIRVVNQEPKRLHYPDLDAAVLCLPHNSLLSGEPLAIEPEPHVRHNILLAHAIIDDERLSVIREFGGAWLSHDAIDPREWSYVALGHYHLHVALAPNMVYAGGIERTSLNIWAEADHPKGLVEFDLDKGRARFHRLKRPRPVIDLRPIEASDLDPEALDAAIESAVEGVKGGIEGKIVRLRVFNIPREIYRELDHRRIREYRIRALHFHLDARPPQVTRREGSGAPGQRLSLEEELVAFLKKRWAPSAGDIDRDALVELGLRYLKEAEEAEAVEG